MTGVVMIATRPDGALLVVVNAPSACTYCGSAHYLFVNELGRSSCLECNGSRQEIADARVAAWTARLLSGAAPLMEVAHA